MTKLKINEWPAVRIHPDQMAQLKKVAKSQGRSVLKQLQWMLKEILYSKDK